MGLFWEGVRGVEGQGKGEGRGGKGRKRKEARRPTKSQILGGIYPPELVQIGQAKTQILGVILCKKTSTDRSISEHPFSCSPPLSSEVLGIDFVVVLGVNFWTQFAPKNAWYPRDFCEIVQKN